MYVKGNFTQTLYNIATISNCKCHVWHKTQTDCRRCRKMDHTTTQTELCKAFFVCEEKVIIIKSPHFVLCNYFPCRMRIFDNEFFIKWTSIPVALFKIHRDV